MSPHHILGLAPTATASEIRAARRELARTLHPDVGGDALAMQRVNAAAADALAILDRRRTSERDPMPETPATGEGSDWTASTRDAPSFTIEALPVEAFEALLVTASELGEVADDDPPYELRVLLGEPFACWCQLDIVPDAGASTVSVALTAGVGGTIPRVIDVRNAWIDALNGLDWSAIGLDRT